MPRHGIARLALVVAAFLVLSAQIARKNDYEYFKKNPQEAVDLLKGRCAQYFADRKNDSGLLEDTECEAAQRLIDEQQQIKDADDLLKALDGLMERLKSREIPAKDDYEKYDRVERRKKYDEFYSQHPKEAQEFILQCMGNPTKAEQNNAECQSAMEAVIKGLQSAKNERVQQQEREVKYQEYFRAHQGMVEQLLEGRCKTILTNPWYEYDTSLQDKECNAAVEARKEIAKAQIQEQRKREEEAKKNVKDEGYFKKNLYEARALVVSCKNEEKPSQECLAARQVMEDLKVDEARREEYYQYYLVHPLAARFFMTECAAQMLKFNIECQAAYDAIKASAQTIKTKDPAKEAAFIRQFRQNPFDAKLILGSKCQKLFEDEWYYLDTSLQDEECDAAERVVESKDY